MAEAAVFGIAKSVLQQLGSPALDEFRLLWGYKDHLDKLKDTITTINNVLEDADRKQATNRAVQGWLGRLRVVLYEAEDLFDTISAKALLEKAKKGTKIRKKVRHFVSKPYRFAFLVKTAHKVKEIRERFDDIARDINEFNFLQNQTDQDAISRIRREETHSFVPRNVVVGREQETEDVVSVLLSDSSQERRGVSVIAVIGIGGLGKTTLAQLVYNDERVQKGFDLCMWVCINYFSDLKQVVITLLKSATTAQEDLTLDRLQSLFRKEIEEKRFLLVLDDVWDEDHQNWRKLKHLLSSGKNGSKVLATTRSEIVAQSLCAIKPYFHLKGISDESAWLLFKKVAFGEEGDQNSSEFEELGRQIVRKCANVPLAIVNIASLLREKEKEKWFPLVNDELSKVIPDEYEKIIHVLEFSYKELPYQVKRCFGYCSLFPKDYEFKKDRLVGLWIAQGFVEPLGNESLEDRAEEYLLYLVKRCFFQLATGDKETRSTVAYQMHDLMHDLAMKVARSECILVDQIDDKLDNCWDKTVRHVSMNCELEQKVVDCVCSFSQSKSFRTFLNPSRSWFIVENDALKKLMLAFGSLRVLDLSDMGIKEVPTSIGGLIHLRFLDLSRNYMKRLPSSVCSLPHLQSLILRKCARLMELPKDLGDLLSLRLLDLSKTYSLERLPSSICSIPHLQSLILRKCKHLKELPEDLGDLVRLRHLVLKGCDSLVKMPPGLAALTSLVNALQLSEDLGSTRCHFLMNALQLPPNLQDLCIEHFGGKEILNGVSNLHKPVILKLEGCKSVVLPPLSHLPSLNELCISDMDSMLTIEDSKVYEHSLFFPSLQTLSIENMWKLKSWWLQAPTVLPTFPRLTTLSICHCQVLTGCMPLFPLVEVLCLRHVREEIIWQITRSKSTSSTSDSVSVLKKLEISRMGDLSSIAEVRRTHLLRVKRLDIQTINRNLFKGLKDLAFLETLTIEDNFNAELQEEDEEEGIQWKHLQKLKTVRLVFGEGFSMRNNQHLLHGFQHLISLIVLDLWKCKELYLSWRALLVLPHL